MTKRKTAYSDKDLISIISCSSKELLNEISPQNSLRIKSINKLPIVLFSVITGTNGGLSMIFFKFAGEILQDRDVSE